MEAYREELAFELVPGEERLVVEGEGVKLCAAVKNPPGAARGTLFFLHGVASNASRWEEFVETTPLGADWRLLRYDLRGHGAPSRPSSSATSRTCSPSWTRPESTVASWWATASEGTSPCMRSHSIRSASRVRFFSIPS